VRASLVAAALALLVTSCGSNGSAPRRGARAAPGTIEAMLDRPGPDVSMVEGTFDYAAGPVRVSFLIVDRAGRSIERPRARIWVARGLRARPFARATAALERVGLPGESAAGDVTHIYVTHIRLARPAKYWMLAEPVGGRPIQAIGNVVVRRRSLSPAVGSRAFASRTPTIASTHGDFAKLTTRVPPDRALLRYSVAGSLTAHEPFVVVFATPKFCSSRTCGPVVDVVGDVSRRFRGTDVRFIHVEIYRDNDPARGHNAWVREWRLPTEPWIFLVGRDGRIKAKFEGSVSVGELTAAVRRYLA
jgi:hypothetical protein